VSISIFHEKCNGNFGKTIRLNLKAVRDLLARDVPSFSSLTDTDKALLQRRFDCYCKHARPDFGAGKDATRTTPEMPPSINNLPSKSALAQALNVN
jgi:hypothetical protein